MRGKKGGDERSEEDRRAEREAVIAAYSNVHLHILT